MWVNPELEVMVDIKEEYKALASHLGIEFKEGVEAFFQSPSLKLMAAGELGAGDLEKAQQFLNNPLIRKMVSKVFMGAATGFYRDYEFAIYRSSTGSGKNSRPVYHANVNLLFPKDLRCGLDIFRRTWMTGIGEFLRPSKYVKIQDDPELCRLAAVRAENKAQAGIFMGSRALRERLAALYRYAPGFTVTDHGIRYKEPGHIMDRQRTVEVMDLLVEAALKF